MERHVKAPDRSNMVNHLKELCENKKILILGFGREGKSTLYTLKMAGFQKHITVADKTDLRRAVTKPGAPIDIRNYRGNGITIEARDSKEGVKFICGENYQECLDDYDIVFKSPGIVLDKQIEDYKCYITSQVQEFLKVYRDHVIGITGTKGKSTTASLLYHILGESGKEVFLAGNIGIPCFDLFIPDYVKEYYVVVELSCHQLEYLSVSPGIATLNNLYEEHLDHYGTYEKYIAAKKNIYKHQKEEDVLFVNSEIVPKEEDFVSGKASRIIAVDHHKGEGKKKNSAESKDLVEIFHYDIYFDGHHIKLDEDRENLIGEHNNFNIAIAYGIAHLIGIDDEAFESALLSYKSLPHRLQFIGEFEGIRYFDDSISTIGETAIQAARSVRDTQTLLIGGMDRGIEYEELEEFIASMEVPNIILMYDTGQRIYMEMQKKGLNTKAVIQVEDLIEAVKKAKEVTKKGGAVILSPAAASYGFFENFEERGRIFGLLVRG